MIEDCCQGGLDTDIEVDICIIGGGAAGITLALSLIDAGVHCCVLESGGVQQNPAIQSLGDVEQDHAGSYTCHLRCLGGATNHWGGWCAPLNPVDFRQRDWVEGHGWPIRKNEIDGYYAAAQRICGLGPFAYSASELVDASRNYQPFDSGKLATRFYQFSSPPKRFGHAYESRLRAAANLRVLLNATVTHLETDRDASAVTSASVRTLEGVRARVHARHFVIACGGVENARLLLRSSQVEKHGLGNGNDLVGRYFMQHPHVPCASLVATEPGSLAHLFDRFRLDGVDVQASLGPNARQQQQHRILNCSATLGRSPDPVSGYGALRQIWRDLKRGRWPDDLGDRVWKVISDLDSLPDAPKLMTLYMRSEQSPNPDSRVVLGTGRDRFGLPRARVEWKLTALDKRTVYIGARLIGEQLAELGVARMKLPEWLSDRSAAWPPELWGGCHLMGTTRMSASPDTGVVNPDCRLHSVGNLYVAGSSVFPTGGYANPTLTIVAMSLRLADHLKSLYA